MTQSGAEASAATGIPRVGSTAPDFVLSNQHGEPVNLSALRGSAVILVFFPFAFSGICTSEMRELQDNLPDFTAEGAVVLAVSVDSKFTLRAYGQAESLAFGLLSDFWPHGEVARLYGVFDMDRGMAARGTFIIDAGGIIRYTVVNPRGQARELGEYRAALHGLRAA